METTYRYIDILGLFFCWSCSARSPLRVYNVIRTRHSSAPSGCRELAHRSNSRRRDVTHRAQLRHSTPFRRAQLSSAQLSSARNRPEQHALWRVWRQPPSTSEFSARSRARTPTVSGRRCGRSPGLRRPKLCTVYVHYRTASKHALADVKRIELGFGDCASVHR